MDKKDIINTVKMYPKAFRDMDTSLVDKFFTKNASKTGFMYDYKTSEWLDISTVGIKEIKEWVLVYNKENFMPNSEIKVELLDVQSKIAVAKIELEWAKGKNGCDYLFLIKEKDSWIINKIIYQSIV